MGPVQVERLSQQQHRNRQQGYEDQEDLQSGLERRCALARLKNNHLPLLVRLCADLSRVERSDVFALHDEHVDEVDEDAGSLAGLAGAVRQPLVDDHENQVAEEAEQEEQLGQKQQVDVEFLLEMPEKQESFGNTSFLEINLPAASFFCSHR